MDNRFFKYMFFLLSIVFVEHLQADSLTGLDERPLNLTCVAPERPSTDASVTLSSVIPGLRGLKPIDMKSIPGDPDKFVVVHNNGQLNLYERSSENVLSEFTRVGEFLDISEDVLQAWNGVYAVEMGMFGISFHPDFQNNGYAYVYYSAFGSEPGSIYEGRLSRFISTDGGITLDRDSEEVILKIDHSLGNNHWGGAMAFDAQGLFYFTLGDATDKPKSQDPDSLLGKVLRLDLDSSFPYGIPADNPFAVSGGRPEVFAMGFRNPWRASIDRVSGELWLGDVGFTEWEEVNLVERGGNYGWPHFEATHCTTFYATCGLDEAIMPIVEYSHSGSGKAVIGGYVYRGSSIPELQGIYIYGDAVTGEIWALRYDENGKAVPDLLYTSNEGIFSFAEDSEGELYVIGRRSVSRLIRNEVEESSTFPRLLSETGCVNPSNPTQPTEGLIPYAVNASLWSDNAEKQRWIALPDWNMENSRITINDNGDWEFPLGTVLVKSFAVDDALVETRLLIRHLDDVWAGYSYEWNDDQSDATLLPGSKTKALLNQHWTYPGPGECMQCHTEVAGISIGPENAQLNRDFIYPSTGREANQLSTLAHNGVIDSEIAGSVESIEALATPQDESSGSLEDRVRAYLHSNCSMCHQPGGLGRGGMDFRYATPIESTGMIDAEPTQGHLGIEGSKVVKPGSPEKSILLQRLLALDNDRMPPLGTAIVDSEGTRLIEEWIVGLSTDNSSDISDPEELNPGLALPSEITIDENGSNSDQPQLIVGTGSIQGMYWHLILICFVFSLVRYRRRCPQLTS